MPWWGHVITILGCAIVASFWGWVALSIIKLSKEIAVLKHAVYIREKECAERLDWLNRIEVKIDGIVSTVARLVGQLDRRFSGKEGLET